MTTTADPRPGPADPGTPLSLAPDLLVRPGTPADVPALTAIAQASDEAATGSPGTTAEEVGEVLAGPDNESWLAAEPFREWLATWSSVPWDQWFVAEVYGEPAASLISSDQFAEQNEGWVRSLAVLPAYRRRGLGRLLLATAFAAYAARGRSRAGLGVDVTNPTGAYALYEAVGMTPVFEADVYEREVAPADAGQAGRGGGPGRRG